METICEPLAILITKMNRERFLRVLKKNLDLLQYVDMPKDKDLICRKDGFAF